MHGGAHGGHGGHMVGMGQHGPDGERHRGCIGQQRRSHGVIQMANHMYLRSCEPAGVNQEV